LKALSEARSAFLLPGAFNALSAKVVEQLGFEAVYLTGAGLRNMSFAVPDLGLIGLTDVAAELGRIRDATSLPLVVDADTGFGNAVNAWHMMKVLERAGADAIQIEDQTFPKRCGHFSGKDVVSTSEMLDRIRAALDARIGDTLVVARTDAAATLGFDAAIERANAMADAGADILFVEALPTRDQLLCAPSLLSRPSICNMVVGGRTPLIEQSEGAACGYGAMLYANVALQGALLGMKGALSRLKRDGRIDEGSGVVATFAERQDAVGKSHFDDLERRFRRDGD
jgi:2-methylisocitrate lyase-like PEP mutase family enzyme